MFTIIVIQLVLRQRLIAAEERNEKCFITTQPNDGLGFLLPNCAITDMLINISTSAFPCLILANAKACSAI